MQVPPAGAFAWFFPFCRACGWYLRHPMARKRRAKRRKPRRGAGTFEPGWVVPASNVLLCVNVLLLAAVLRELN